MPPTLRRAQVYDGDESPMGARALNRRLGPWLARVLVVWLSVELAVGGGLFLVSRYVHTLRWGIDARSLTEEHRGNLERLLAGQSEYGSQSPALGWSIRPDGQLGPYRANAQGLRADREWTRRPAPGVVRIATFGDSFTHGNDVRNAETWQEVLMAGNPRLEVLNFGVGAFGLDQSFLRYRLEGVAYEPRIVLIGFMTENLFRQVNVYRPFYRPDSGPALAKPRFVLDQGRLVLVQNPIPELAGYRELLAHPERVLPRLGRRDLYYQVRPHQGGPLDFLPTMRLSKTLRWAWIDWRLGLDGGPYHADGEPYRVTIAIVDEFVGAARARGSIPVVVVFPRRQDLNRFRRDGRRSHAVLLDHLRQRGYRYLDLVEAFAEAAGRVGSEALIPNHYSPAGNRLVAETLARYLEREHLLATAAPAPRRAGGPARDALESATAGAALAYTRGGPSGGGRGGTERWGCSRAGWRSSRARPRGSAAP